MSTHVIEKQQFKSREAWKFDRKLQRQDKHIHSEERLR